MKDINWLFYVCIFVFGLALIHANKQIQCKNFKDRRESLILQTSINLVHMCRPDSAMCVNNAILYKLEYTELMNAELKDLGCRN